MSIEMGRSPAPLAEDYLWLNLSPGTLRQLLLAGLGCFAEFGFHGTSTRDISTRAGMSSAAMYTHFRSKAELLFTISEAGHQDSWRVVQEALAASHADSKDRVAAFVRAFSLWHARNHRLARVAQQELRGLTRSGYERIQTLRRRFRPVIESELQNGMDAGVFEIRDVGGAALTILSMGIDLTRWYRPGGERTPENLAELHAALVLRMIDPATTVISTR